MERGFFLYLRRKKELGASIKRTIIVNISFIIHMIFERAFAHFLIKNISLFCSQEFSYGFSEVFLRKFCLLAQKTTFSQYRSQFSLLDEKYVKYPVTRNLPVKKPVNFAQPKF